MNEPEPLQGSHSPPQLTVAGVNLAIEKSFYRERDFV